MLNNLAYEKRSLLRYYNIFINELIDNIKASDSQKTRQQAIKYFQQIFSK